MILTKEQIEELLKSIRGTKNWNTLTTEIALQTALHYISEAEYWQEKFEIVTSDMVPKMEVKNDE